MRHFPPGVNGAQYGKFFVSFIVPTRDYYPEVPLILLKQFTLPGNALVVYVLWDVGGDFGPQTRVRARPSREPAGE
jgi:hypothetical protein